MKKILSNEYLKLCSRVVLGIVFIIASIDKIAVPEAFASNIQAYGLVPFPAINFMALILPWLELLCGIFLVGGVLIRSSSLLLSLLLAIFTLSMIIVLLQGLKIDCGCFGAQHSFPVNWLRVIEDIGLLSLGVHNFLNSDHRFSIQNLIQPNDQVDTSLLSD